MPKAKQLTAWVKNKPGELLRITKAMGKARVNIVALSCYNKEGDYPVHLQVTNHVKAKKVLQDMQIRVTEEEVLQLNLPDKPGILGETVDRLAQANINIEYAYGTVSKGSGKAEVTLGVSDTVGAARILRSLQVGVRKKNHKRF